MNAINKDFRRKREELNLSQQDAAILLDVSRAWYNRWEQDPNTMPIGKYEELMEHFARLTELKDKE